MEEKGFRVLLGVVVGIFGSYVVCSTMTSTGNPVEWESGVKGLSVFLVCLSVFMFTEGKKD